MLRRHLAATNATRLALLPPQPRTVVRAAAEEVKTASSNGAPVKGSATALEFDELTELIKWVDVAEAPACGPAGLHQ